MARPSFRAFSVVLFALTPHLARGADHFDGPQVSDDPATDIADVYAWMSSDASRVRLVLDIVADRFSDAVQYVFHLESAAELGPPSATRDLICTFDAEQKISCWLGDDEYAGGDASRSPGITSASGRMRVFAGKRSDPFFFNAEGFSATISRVRVSTTALSFDEAGCPLLDQETANTLAGGLATDPFGEALAHGLQDGRRVGVAASRARARSADLGSHGSGRGEYRARQRARGERAQRCRAR
jgi:hypothetical protein